MLGFTSVFAQNFDNYTPLTCSGKIPDEFTTPSTKKYKSEIKKLEKKKIKKRERREREQFALESSFVIDDLLQSGLVLFGDPISAYLNEVAAKVVAADPSFKKKVSIYALRSTAVNAFATDRGTIFVTLGLLAQLENEAQLAYILSHEMTHVQEGHALNLFLEAKEISRNADKLAVYGKSKFDEKLLSKNRYSKQLESEADNKGLERLLRTGYTTDDLASVFDVLEYAYLPFDEIAFERSFFESGTYHLPDYYWLKDVAPIGSYRQQQDSLRSTHPDVSKRREEMISRLKQSPKSGGTKFLVSEERFNQVRKMARFELPTMFLHKSLTAEAIYIAHLLLQEHPDNAYLQKCVAKALYLQSKYKNDRDYTLQSSWAETEGESQRVQFLMDTISARENTVLGLRYAWQQHLRHPDDKELTAITKDLFVDLGQFSTSLSDFSENAVTAAPAEQPEKEEKEVKKSDKKQSKYDKIKETKKKTETETNGWRTAFEDFKNSDDFKTAFDEGQKRYAKNKEHADYLASKKGVAETRKRLRDISKHGYRLGVNKVLVVNPFYLKLDARKENAIQYIQSESGQVRLSDIIADIAKKAELKITQLDVAALNEGQADKFNDIRVLNEWFSEQLAYDKLPVTQGVNQAQVNAVADKYGVDHVLYTGVISLREKKKGAILSFALGVLYPPLLPLAIYGAARPDYDMLYYAVVFNVKEGTFQTIKYDYFNLRDSDTLLKSHYYDTFLQIKAKPEKR